MGKAALIYLFLIISFLSEAQPDSDEQFPQFLFPEFSRGSIKLKNGLSQIAVLNYNTISEKMVYRKDERLYDLVNPENIAMITLQDRIFIPAGKVFHQVLLIAPISLYVQYKGELIPPGTEAVFGVPSRVSNTKSLSSVILSMGSANLKLPEYTVELENVYWIRIDGNFNSFLNEKQFLKLFAGKADELKEFIRKSRIKFDNTSDVQNLIKHCNDMIPPGTPISRG